MTETLFHGSDSDALAVQENMISRNVLKIVDPKLYNITMFYDKQIEFRDTCIAIHSIVSFKLYRCVSSSLEAYFKKKWGVSRAQTYRLFECAPVLKLLNGLNIIPHKERICRQLKSCVGLGGTHLLDLWLKVLEATRGLESIINNFNIEDFWTQTSGQKLIHSESKISKSKKKSLVRRIKDGGSDTDFSEDLDTYAPKKIHETNSSRFARRACNTEQKLMIDGSLTKEMYLDANGNKLYRPAPSSLDENYLPALDSNELNYKLNEHKTNIAQTEIQKLDASQKIEQDWNACQNSMQKLNSRGYKIESMIGGQWLQPTIWKLVGPDYQQPVSSLDHLVMAAQWAFLDCL